MSSHVLGIGGIFFRSKDPEKLAEWYKEHLGIPFGNSGEIWSVAAGPLVFAPFKKDSTYFPDPQSVMLNFRVKDIDGLIDELKTKGVRIDEKRQDEDYGRFAWIYDADGNKIELWQETGG